jgi:hypothetical protein
VEPADSAAETFAKAKDFLVKGVKEIVAEGLEVADLPR